MKVEFVQRTWRGDGPVDLYRAGGGMPAWLVAGADVCISKGNIREATGAKRTHVVRDFGNGSGRIVRCAPVDFLGPVKGGVREG